LQPLHEREDRLPIHDAMALPDDCGVRRGRSGDRGRSGRDDEQLSETRGHRGGAGSAWR
jgi:hypothetical protein